MGAAVVMGLYPFFVEISAGGLNPRTHLPVRPNLLHRGTYRVTPRTPLCVLPDFGLNPH